jgi:hypothetical protein
MICAHLRQAPLASKSAVKAKSLRFNDGRPRATEVTLGGRVGPPFSFQGYQR